MRTGRLIKYAVISVTSGTIGFLIGGGEVPDSLRAAPQALATQALDRVEPPGPGHHAVTGDAGSPGGRHGCRAGVSPVCVSINGAA